MASVLVPVFYVFVLFGGLFIFGHFYRKRSASMPQPLPGRLYSRAHVHSSGKQIEPYFPRHHERDTYVSLLQRTDPPASDGLLRAALVRRAIADVQRILRIREDKPALQNLLQKGSVGDDLWNSLLAAEKELEAEIVEVHAEANTFVEGWGQVLFQTASEMLANEKTRAIVEQIPLERARNGIPSSDPCPLCC
jgi:translocation protein SEC66